MTRRLLVVGALALGLAAAGVVLVARRGPAFDYVIPAHGEQAVLAFIEPLELGGPVGEGFTLSNVVIDHATIRLEVSPTTGGAHSIVDVTRGSGDGVEIDSASSTPTIVTSAIRQAMTRERTAGSPWVAVELPRGEPLKERLQRGLSEAAHKAPVACLVLELAALVMATLILLGPRLRRAPAVTLAALTILAFVLRARLSPHSFMHEYYHIESGWLFMLKSESGNQYGLTGPAISRIADFFLHADERSIFLGTSVVAAATIPAVALFAFVLFESWPVALLAGFIVCVLPVHLRFSASEELWIPGILFSYWSLAAWGCWLRTPTRSAMVVAVLALSLAMQSRSELLVLPVAHVGLVLALRSMREWLRTLFGRPVLIGVGALLLLLSYHLKTLYGIRDELPPLNPLSMRILREHDTLVDWSVTQRALLALAAVAALGGLLKRPKVVLWLLVFAAAYVLLPLMAFANRPCIYRTQMFAMTLIGVLAAASPLLLRGWWRPVAAVLVALLALHGLWSRRHFVTDVFDQQLEFAFLQQSVPELPEHGALIGYFETSDGAPAKAGPQFWMDSFPTFLLDRSGKHLSEVSVADPGFQPGADALYYQGMYCYVSEDRTRPMTQLRDECRSVHERYQLEPLRVTRLDTVGYSAAQYVAGPYDIGFFRVTTAARDRR